MHELLDNPLSWVIFSHQFLSICEGEEGEDHIAIRNKSQSQIKLELAEILPQKP